MSGTPNLTSEGQRLADALPPENEFADIIQEAVSNHNDMGYIFWVGVAREVAQAVGDAALLLTAPEREGAGLREALDRHPTMEGSVEPSLRQMVRSYYGRHFTTAEAERLTGLYVAALTKQPAAQEPSAAGVVLSEHTRTALRRLASCAEAAVATNGGCVAEWLDAEAENARSNDPEVGIFGNEDMAALFETLGSLVEDIAPMGTTIGRELRALATLTPAAPKTPDAATADEDEDEADLPRIDRIERQMLQHGGVDSHDMEWLAAMARTALGGSLAPVNGDEKTRDLIFRFIAMVDDIWDEEAADVEALRDLANITRAALSPQPPEAETPAGAGRRPQGAAAYAMRETSGVREAARRIALSTAPAARPGDEVEALRDLSGMATPGPWVLDPSAPYAKISGQGWRDFAKVAVQMDGLYAADGVANANLIVQAVNLVRSQLAAAPEGTR